MTTLWLARALSLQGWKVVESQEAAGSKMWMLVRIEFASLPDLPPPVFERAYAPVQ